MSTSSDHPRNPLPPRPVQAPWPWRTVLCIGLIYAAVAQGRIAIEDSNLMLTVSRSMAAGHLDTPPGPLMVLGPDGRSFCHFGLLTSLWWFPFMLGGRLLHALGAPMDVGHCEEFVVSFASGFVAVACLAYLAWYWREKGVPARRVRSGLWLWGLASVLFPYAKLPGSDIIMGLALLAALIHFELRGDRARHLALTGLWLGLALMARKQAQTIVPVLGVWMAARIWIGSPEVRRMPAVAKRLGQIAAGAAGPVAIHLTYNLIRFGSPVVERYPQAEYHVPGVIEWVWRAWLLTAGLDHGFVVYNLVVVVVLAYGCAHIDRGLAWLLAALWATQTAFLAMLPYWNGGVCFGSRFLLYLVLIAGTAWPGFVAGRHGAVRRIVFVAALVIAVGVQAVGVTVDPLAARLRYEWAKEQARNQLFGGAMETIRVLGLPGGELPPALREVPEMSHPPLQVPDLWWCQIIRMRHELRRDPGSR